MQDEISGEQRAEIDAFLADSRTLRFVECDDNWTALGTFIDAHSLPTDSESMVFAYETLVKQGALELVPFAAPIPAPDPPVVAPAPTPQQPTPQSVMPVKARTTMYRNGQPLEGRVNRYGDR